MSTEIEHVEILDAAPRGLLVIAVSRALPFELTEEELLRRLDGTDAGNQIRNAALVIATDPNATMARIIKCEVHADEQLTMHTASIG